MSHGKKLLIAGLTVWPIIYTFIFIGIWFSTFFAMQAGKVDDSFVSGFAALFVVHGLTMVLMLGNVAFYAYKAFNNKSLPEDRRLLWFLVVFMTGPIGQSIYWYKFIWPDNGLGVDGAL